MDPVVLALDLGTKCGWAVSFGPSGVHSFEHRDRVMDEVRHGRLGFRFAGWLGDLIVEHGPSYVVIERAVGRDLKGHAGQVLLGLRMIALAQCFAHELAVQEIAEGEWKAWARKNLPEWVKGDEADAKALLAYWLADRAPRVEAA